MNGIEELRRTVKLFDICNETFNEQFTAEQLLVLYRLHIQSGWDIPPDQWTENQIEAALAMYVVPKWNDNEEPIEVSK